MATFRLNTAGMREMMTSPQGAAFRILRQKAALVEAEAKRRCPVDTGRLRSSITTEMLVMDGQPVAKVGSNLSYSRFVHEGTGIYGPRGRPIRPVNAKFLRFRPHGSKDYVYARQVRGVRPRPFLRDALRAALGP